MLEPVPQANEESQRLARRRHRLRHVESHTTEVEPGAEIASECAQRRYASARVGQRSVGLSDKPSSAGVDEHHPRAVAMEVVRARPWCDVLSCAHPHIVVRLPVRMKIKVQVSAILRLQKRNAAA